MNPEDLLPLDVTEYRLFQGHIFLCEECGHRRLGSLTQWIGVVCILCFSEMVFLCTTEKGIVIRASQL
jgi:hypothetical protein